ncbi:MULTISPECIES: NAD(P)/FAD-dependent oxidoreductase [Burkholderia]|uniref:FAD dependent oxidoreductase n=4 Tax=Bacteria TaxID=2 RepID=B2T0Y9_PARPJ|nr:MULTISPECIES: FAD-binding oxidoreductase [Burkholderia]ACD14709.1 FAD dependent oxidoreductase [Paraburkholderia phytofirmans PsJN]MDP9546017.1 glycine/D-amino acid oxidase-like deaminating enzyme [Burkholderia cepacia]PRZ55742.1 glycine/D-amino acid oxidase-like deaminating enzyme [Paraburkholderia fungorum]UTP22425.1 FAD-binding oxidoreductase [Burkholderia sp. FXe9]MDO5923360.1 FAD-binding oxidoreductase [Burkholderia cenocepacia]
MNDRYDLAIVGGGIVGAWTLYLATLRHPGWRIVLVDRYRVGDGATAHSAGVLLATGRSARERKLAAISADLYGSVQAPLGLNTTRADVFWVTDAQSSDEVRTVAVDFSIGGGSIPQAELESRLGLSVRLDAVQTVLRGGTAISHDPGLIARSLISASLRSANVSCVEGAAVTKMQPSAGGTELCLADGRALHAARSVVAVGPWIIEQPFEAFADAHDVRIKKVVALHVDRAPQPDAAAVFFPQDDAYLMPLPARNQWLFSFRSDEWDCRPRKHALEISDRDRNVAEAVLRRYLPDLADVCCGGRVFCDAYTSTGEPLVSLDPCLPAVFAGAGSGAGFRLAPGIAEEALRLIEA